MKELAEFLAALDRGAGQNELVTDCNRLPAVETVTDCHHLPEGLRRMP